MPDESRQSKDSKQQKPELMLFDPNESPETIATMINERLEQQRSARAAAQSPTIKTENDD